MQAVTEKPIYKYKYNREQRFFPNKACLPDRNSTLHTPNSTLIKCKRARDLNSNAFSIDHSVKLLQ